MKRSPGRHASSPGGRPASRLVRCLNESVLKHGSRSLVSNWYAATGALDGRKSSHGTWVGVRRSSRTCLGGGHFESLEARRKRFHAALELGEAQGAAIGHSGVFSHCSMKSSRTVRQTRRRGGLSAARVVRCSRTLIRSAWLSGLGPGWRRGLALSGSRGWDNGVVAGWRASSSRTHARLDDDAPGSRAPEHAEHFGPTAIRWASENRSSHSSTSPPKPADWVGTAGALSPRSDSSRRRDRARGDEGG